MLDLLRFEELTPPERRTLAVKLDRLTARFAFAVIGATVVLFGFHAIRVAARMVAT